MPAGPATWLVPSAHPGCSAGNASTRIAAELAVSIDPPTACTTRQPISQSAAVVPRNGSKDNSTEATVNTTKPAL